MGDLLTAKRASLTRVRMAPTTGDDAEVPYTKRNFPLTCKERPVRISATYRNCDTHRNDVVGSVS